MFPPPLPYIQPDILESGGVRETAGVCYVRVYGRGEGHFGPAVCCSTVWVPIFLETSAWHVWAPCRSVHGTAASPRRPASSGDTRSHLQGRKQKDTVVRDDEHFSSVINTTSNKWFIDLALH